jgi:type IV pilus assembly protein PilA
LPSTITSISGKYVESVDVANGKITAVFGKESNDKLKLSGQNTLILSPTDEGGSISWNCKSAAGTTVTQAYLPTSCRN